MALKSVASLQLLEEIIEFVRQASILFHIFQHYLVIFVYIHPMINPWPKEPLKIKSVSLYQTSKYISKKNVKVIFLNIPFFFLELKRHFLLLIENTLFYYWLKFVHLLSVIFLLMIFSPDSGIKTHKKIVMFNKFVKYQDIMVISWAQVSLQSINYCFPNVTIRLIDNITRVLRLKLWELSHKWTKGHKKSSRRVSIWATNSINAVENVKIKVNEH